jgi:hypothetical protein
MPSSGLRRRLALPHSWYGPLLHPSSLSPRLAWRPAPSGDRECRIRNPERAAGDCPRQRLSTSPVCHDGLTRRCGAWGCKRAGGLPGPVANAPSRNGCSARPLLDQMQGFVAERAVARSTHPVRRSDRTVMGRLLRPGSYEVTFAGPGAHPVVLPSPDDRSWERHETSRSKSQTTPAEPPSNILTDAHPSSLSIDTRQITAPDLTQLLHQRPCHQYRPPGRSERTARPCGLGLV